MTLLATFAALSLLAGGRATSQEPATGGTITGTVRDEQGKPIVGADVFAFPETARTKTDSLGHFVLANLKDGFYHVRARRLGYRPAETTTDLSKHGKVDVTIELARRPVLLDSVVVRANGECPALSYRGFNCRRHGGKGVYLTDDDILDKGAVELGDVFRDVAGFRIELVPTPWGRKPVPLSTLGNRCLNALINGKPYASTNQLPLYADELVAVEIYARASDVPPEYERFVWDGRARVTNNPVDRARTSERCALVVYWTMFA